MRDQASIRGIAVASTDDNTVGHRSKWLSNRISHVVYVLEVRGCSLIGKKFEQHVLMNVNSLSEVHCIG